MEIHAQAAELGGNLVERFGGRVIADDVLEGAILLEPAQTFDLVVSLSAVEWNEQVRENIRAAWKFVADGGVLLMTIRLHPHTCPDEINDSYQSTTRTSVKECIFAAAVLRKGLGGNNNTKFVVHSPPSLVEQLRSIHTKNDGARSSSANVPQP